MGARSKLNGASLNGALFIGVLVGVASGNLLAGLVIGAILAGTSLLAGDIRISSRRRDDDPVIRRP